MSEWTPTPQAYRGPADPENGFRRVGEKFADAGRQMRDGLNHLLQSAGIRVEPGKLIIEGDLEVPNGKIKNEWLEHPIAHDYAFGAASGFALPLEWTDLTSCAITVPEGFNKMQFNAGATVQAVNDSGATQYLRAHIRREDGTSTFGSQTPRSTLASLFIGSVVVSYVYSDDVVPGTTHTFTLEAFGSFSADALNTARLDVTAMFFKG